MPALDYRPQRAEVLRYLGWRGQTLSPDLEDRLAAMTALSQATAEPRWVWRRFAFSLTPAGVALAGADLTFRGRDLAAHLAGAEALAVLCVTLGHGVERTLLRLQAGALTDALLYNAASTALIEEAADRCAKEIRRAAPGYHINGRYSPGYGDFPLEQQGDLLTLLQAGERLGVTLTAGDLMLPRKTVTAVLGLFREAQTHQEPCQTCAMRTFCTYRKTGERCG